MNELRERILYILVQSPDITSIEIARKLGIYQELANHHLINMFKTHIVKRQRKPYFNGNQTRNIYHYIVNDDYLKNHSITEQAHPVEFEEITPLMQRWLGINTKKIPYDVGQVYTEQTFEQLQKDKGYKSWNPSKPKSQKNYVTGTTLSWL